MKTKEKPKAAKARSQAPANCECDNTHEANSTVCRPCWDSGRRHPSTPPKDLVAELLEAKDAYYAGAPLMTDAAFDTLELQLQAIAPADPYFKLVGAAAAGNTKTKLRHLVPMLSAGKAKTPEEAWAWLEKIGMAGQKILVEPKIDGLSATVKYKAGKLVYVATRGDGQVGQDITHIAAYLPSIPKTLPRTDEFEARGELYIPKNSPMPNPEGKPLRNVAVGYINRKGERHALADLAWIKFRAYQLVGSEVDQRFESEIASAVGPKGKPGVLASLGFEVVPTSSFSTLSELEEVYRLYLDRDRAAWEFETDGLVLVVDDRSQYAGIDAIYEVNHHHHYNLALKPPSEGKPTTLLGIEWNVSRQGRLIPVALVKPVALGGVVVKRCTLNNHKNVMDLRLYPGDQVLVERANDVIPFFSRNITGEAPKEARTGAHASLTPASCPSCGEPVTVSGIHLVCENAGCEEQRCLKVIHWVVAAGMESFSEASVRALFNAGKVKKVSDLYRLTPADFEGVEGFGPAKTKNALEQIEASKSMNIRQFVDRLSIDLVGERAIEKLGLTTAQDVLDFKDETFVVGKNLISFVAQNREFLEDLLNCIDIVPIAAKTGTSGKLVCMTGTGPKTRQALVDLIEAKGDHFIDRVTKDVAILVCEDVAGTSSKLQKARKMGIQLMSYGDYFA